MISRTALFAAFGFATTTCLILLGYHLSYFSFQDASRPCFSLPNLQSSNGHLPGLLNGTENIVSGAVSGTRFVMKTIRKKPEFSDAGSTGSKKSPQFSGTEGPKCANWAVLTTINEPSHAIKILHSMPKWCVVVIADLKSVDGAKFWSMIDPILHNETLVYLTPEHQTALKYLIANSLPWNSFGRKNIGYLYAIQHGAEVIFDVDDDNIPRDHIELPTKVPKVCTFAEDLVFNPYPYFGAPAAWPRGYPLDQIRSSGRGTVYSTGRSVDDSCTNIGMIQSLADNDPDVDALYRLSPSALPINFTRRLFPIAIAPGGMAPSNAQALVIFSTCFWAAFLPVTVHGRVADIWRGYIALAIMKLTGHQLAFSSAFVTQYRNPHNYLEDYNAEAPLYERAGPLAEFLTDWQCHSKQASVPICVEALYVELYEHGILEWDDVQHVKGWLLDLAEVGYIFPEIKRTSYRPPQASARLEAPLFSSVMIRGFRLSGGRVILPPGFSGPPPAKASARCSEWCHTCQEGCGPAELSRTNCKDALIENEPFFPAWSAAECTNLCREKPECDGWSFEEPSDFDQLEPQSAANKLRDDTWLLDDLENHERRQRLHREGQPGGEKGKCVLRTEEWNQTDEFLRWGESTRPIFTYFGVTEAASLRFTSSLANRRVTLFAADSDMPRRGRLLAVVVVNRGFIFSQKLADGVVDYYGKAMSKEYTRHVVDIIFAGPSQCFGQRQDHNFVVAHGSFCRYWVLLNPWANSGNFYIQLAMAEQSFPGYKGYLMVHDDFFIGKGIWSDSSTISSEIHVAPLTDAFLGPPLNQKNYSPRRSVSKSPLRLGLMDDDSAWFTFERARSGHPNDRTKLGWPGWSNELFYPGSVMGVGGNNMDASIRAFRALHALSTGWVCDPEDCDTEKTLNSRISDWDGITPQYLLSLEECQSDGWYVGNKFAAEMGLTLIVMFNAGVFLEVSVCVAAKLAIPARYSKQVSLCTSWTGNRGDPTQWYDPTFCATGHPFKPSNDHHARLMQDLLDPGFNAKNEFLHMSDPLVRSG